MPILIVCVFKCCCQRLPPQNPTYHVKCSEYMVVSGVPTCVLAHAGADAELQEFSPVERESFPVGRRLQGFLLPLLAGTALASVLNECRLCYRFTTFPVPSAFPGTEVPQLRPSTLWPTGTLCASGTRSHSSTYFSLFLTKANVPACMSSDTVRLTICGVMVVQLRRRSRSPSSRW